MPARRPICSSRGKPLQRWKNTFSLPCGGCFSLTTNPDQHHQQPPGGSFDHRADQPNHAGQARWPQPARGRYERSFGRNKLMVKWTLGPNHCNNLSLSLQLPNLHDFYISILALPPPLLPRYKQKLISRLQPGPSSIGDDTLFSALLSCKLDYMTWEAPAPIRIQPCTPRPSISIGPTHRIENARQICTDFWPRVQKCRFFLSEMYTLVDHRWVDYPLSCPNFLFDPLAY